MKKFVSLLLSLVLLVSLSIPAFADFGKVPTEEGIFTLSEDPGGPMRPEETIWYYRITDTGLFQKRLWSITYGYWLTDWITIGTVDP